MEPQQPADPETFPQLRIDVLRRAVAVYLGLAYDGCTPSEAVRRRLEWPAEADTATLLTRPPFERVSKAEPGAQGIYALRLGNAHYPHMKLQIQPWPNAAGFLLSVNTHDQVLALDPERGRRLGVPRSSRPRTSVSRKRSSRRGIREGLPTFLRYASASTSRVVPR